MHFTFYLKTSKSSICHTSSKTGIRQDYYIRPPPVSTLTVKYRVYYPVQCMVDPGECLQGMIPSSPFLWWKIKCTKAHLVCPKWRKRGPAIIPGHQFWARKGASSVWMFLSFAHFWVCRCSIVCLYKNIFYFHGSMFRSAFDEQKTERLSQVRIIRDFILSKLTANYTVCFKRWPGPLSLICTLLEESLPCLRHM